MRRPDRLLAVDEVVVQDLQVVVVGIRGTGAGRGGDVLAVDLDGFVTGSRNLVVPEDGAMIQVQATGVCRSDWYGWKGYDADVG